MANSRATGRLVVDPQNATLAVDITLESGGAAASPVTARNGATPISLPASVTAATSFWLPPARYVVVVTLNSTEIHRATYDVENGSSIPVALGAGDFELDPDEIEALIGPGPAGSETYADAGSHQVLSADLTLDDAAGRDAIDGTSFLGAIMGNVLGGALTKAANYIGGLIGHFSATSTATTYPAGAVLAGIGDGVDDAGVHGVVAYIDGDSETTRAGAAFKVKSNNSTAASGFDFGLDLQDAAHDGFQPVDKNFYLKAPVRLVEDVVELVGTGAPTDGGAGTGVGVAGPGSRYTDIATGTLYTNTNTKASPTWEAPGGSGASGLPDPATGSPAQVPAVNGTSDAYELVGPLVAAVDNGDNINVDSSDPANPIVSVVDVVTGIDSDTGISIDNSGFPQVVVGLSWPLPNPAGESPDNIVKVNSAGTAYETQPNEVQAGAGPPVGSPPWALPLYLDSSDANALYVWDGAAWRGPYVVTP